MGVKQRRVIRGGHFFYENRAYAASARGQRSGKPKKGRRMVPPREGGGRGYRALSRNVELRLFLSAGCRRIKSRRDCGGRGFRQFLRRARRAAANGGRHNLFGTIRAVSAQLACAFRPLRQARSVVCEGARLRLRRGARFDGGQFLPRFRAGYGGGESQGRRDDLLRPRISRKRAHPHARRGGTHPGAERMSHGDQPPVAAARARV